MTSLRRIWSGRTDYGDEKSKRFHEIVQLEKNIDPIPNVAIVGFQCDEGVRRNQGRIGAKEGPNAIRKALANIPWHGESACIADLGNISCEDAELEKAQKLLGEKIAEVRTNGSKVIVLGGGHETLYGHYLGIRQTIGRDKKLGIINIDAHFDLRSYEETTSSGTMFKQILDHDNHASYCVIGIQQYGNTLELFERAKEFRVTTILEQQIRENMNQALNEIDSFINQNEVILLTLCMDVINAAEAPGVSAPSPFGLNAVEVRKIIQHVLQSPKVASFDICEVNPTFDLNGQTAKLAAYFVNEVIMFMIKQRG
ncbi:formimidoylglutamase [Ureibacillus sp. FSL K6-2830]|uniref:formimidoylglutamase n=1 Tax=Ureibacillus sp. FSL K6-2830 TaxID=2954610 RepID=UPI0030F7CFBB